MFVVGGKVYIYFFIFEVEKNGLIGVLKLLFLLKVVLENLLCFEDGCMVIKDDIVVCVEWLKNKILIYEIFYCFVCVFMQDFIGVLVVVDLVVMWDVVVKLGGDL